MSPTLDLAAVEARLAYALRTGLHKEFDECAPEDVQALLTHCRALRSELDRARRILADYWIDVPEIAAVLAQVADGEAAP